MRENAAFRILKNQLSALSPGEVEIAETRRVAAILAVCWRDFAGAQAEGMHEGKLRRIEAVYWDPPALSFRIERHGAMSLGSTRAEVQRWRVDVDRRTAECERGQSYRQVRPNAGAIRAEPVAQQLAESIIAGSSDPRLKWREKTTVCILMAKIFPYGSGYMQTVTGRRKRLRAVLGTLLVEHGWRELQRDVYAKEP